MVQNTLLLHESMELIAFMLTPYREGQENWVQENLQVVL